MKKRLLFVSLFLISILFISSCAVQESPGAASYLGVLNMLSSCEIEHQLVGHAGTEVMSCSEKCAEFTSTRKCTSAFFQETIYDSEDNLMSFRGQPASCEDIPDDENQGEYDHLYCTCCSTPLTMQQITR